MAVIGSEEGVGEECLNVCQASTDDEQKYSGQQDPRKAMLMIPTFSCFNVISIWGGGGKFKLSKIRECSSIT